MTQDPLHRLARAALRGKYPKEPTRHLLEAYLYHPEPAVRHGALTGLMEIQSPASLWKVKKAKERETDPENKQVIKEFIKTVGE